MFKKIISIALILALVFAGGFWTAKQLVTESEDVDTGPVYSTKPVIKEDISVGVNTSGQLNASDNGRIRVPDYDDWEHDIYDIQLKVEEYLAEEGDSVVKGQKLIRLSSTNLLEKIEKFEDELSNEQERLSSMFGIKKSEIDSINPYDGIIIKAPIAGKITNLSAEEGLELKSSLIAKIVDTNKLIIEFKVTKPEFEKIKEGQKVKLNYTGFEGYYDGEITSLNENPVPDEGEGYGTTYVYWGEIEADNPGLIQPGMEMLISTLNGDNFDTTFYNKGKVESYGDEKNVNNVMATEDNKAIVTEVYVKDNAVVEEGDPLIKLASASVLNTIERSIERIDMYKTSIEKAYEIKDNLFVTAPMDGIISKWDNVSGDDLWGSQSIGSVFNPNDMIVYAQVDDLDVINIKQDSKVVVTIDALPNEKFEGVVKRISQNRTENGIIKYSVEIRVSGSGKLREGMQANCFIDAGHSEDTLLIPIEAVYEDEGKPTVDVLKEDGTVEKVKIKDGLMNDMYVEVVEGLEEGQLVVTGSSSDILPSEHIKGDDTLMPTENKGDDENKGIDKNGDSNKSE